MSAPMCSRRTCTGGCSGPGASQRELVHAGRFMTLVVGAISIALALFMAGGGSDKLFRNMVTLFSTAAAPVAIPMLLGLTWRRATNRGVLTGFAVGLATGFILLGLFAKRVHVPRSALEEGKPHPGLHGAGHGRARGGGQPDAASRPGRPGAHRRVPRPPDGAHRCTAGGCPAGTGRPANQGCRRFALWESVSY